MFVVANSVKAVQPYCYISFRNHKAGFLRQYRFGGLAEFAKTQGSLASFVTYLPNFFLKMANSEKVSGAVKNSTRTAPITPYSRLKSEEREKSQGLFKVKFYGVGKWRTSVGTEPHLADIHFSDNYQASSAFEAAGMAIDAIQKQHPQYDIVLRSIKCSLLNPAAR